MESLFFFMIIRKNTHYITGPENVINVSSMKAN